MYARVSCCICIGAEEVGDKTNVSIVPHPLLPGPELLNEDAACRYTMLRQLVARGLKSWPALSAEAGRDLDAVVAGFRPQLNKDL